MAATITIQIIREKYQKNAESAPSVIRRSIFILLKKSSTMHKVTNAADPIHDVNAKIEKNPSDITNRFPSSVNGAVLPYPIVLKQNGR
jgi:hypothetical protein